MDPNAPDDYFLFTVVSNYIHVELPKRRTEIILQSDNDFISTQGISLGVPFNAGEDVDNQFLVFRLTLPGATIGDLH